MIPPKIMLLALAMIASLNMAFTQENVSTITENGLLTSTFKTNNGDITIHLPSNLYAGDIISGTVIAEPNGKNSKQIEKNKNILSGYVIELEDKEVPVENDKLTWEILAIIKGGISYLILKDLNGKELAKTPISLIKTPRGSLLPKELSDLDFNIPDYFRAGETEMIPGFFDGDFNNSRIKINDIETNILAESPEGIFFETPENMDGRFDVELNEKDFTLTEEVNLLNLNLSADKLNLVKGDRTTVNIEVAGLDGIENDIPLNISNLTPSSIKMEGGNHQEIMIRPTDIDENGTYTTTARVTAVRSGGFSVMVKVDPPENNFIKIISPADGDEIETNTPEFKWEGFGFPDKVSYTLKLYALKENQPFGQTKEDFFNMEPVFMAQDLNVSTLQLPENSSLNFEEFESFAWVVEGYDGINGDFLESGAPSIFYPVSTNKCRCGRGSSGEIYANLINAENGIEGYVKLSRAPRIIHLPPGPLTLNFVKANLNCGRCRSADCSVNNITYNPTNPQITPSDTTQTLNIAVSWDCTAIDCLSERCTYTYKLEYRKARRWCDCGDVKVTTTIRNINPQNPSNLNSSATITKHCEVESTGQQRLDLSDSLRFDDGDEIEIRISGIQVKCWCRSGLCDTSPTDPTDVRDGRNVTIYLGRDNTPDDPDDNYNLGRIGNANDGWQANGDYVIRAQIKNNNHANRRNIYQDFIIRYDCTRAECNNCVCTKSFRIYLGQF